MRLGEESWPEETANGLLMVENTAASARRHPAGALDNREDGRDYLLHGSATMSRKLNPSVGKQTRGITGHYALLVLLPWWRTDVTYCIAQRRVQNGSLLSEFELVNPLFSFYIWEPDSFSQAVWCRIISEIEREKKTPKLTIASAGEDGCPSVWVSDSQPVIHLKQIHAKATVSTVTLTQV
ncbi:hypothetical protein Bbelb_230040 [Branchiostoma belcheri]|nr:hypothetical protein Bbelb_230040 [Branchiostoma belcheri]